MRKHSPGGVCNVTVSKLWLRLSLEPLHDQFPRIRSWSGSGFLINSAEIFSRDQLVTTRNSSLSESQVFDEIIIFFFFFFLIPRYDSEVYDEGGNSLQSLDYDTEQVDVRDAPSEEVYTLYYPQEKRWAPSPPPSLSLSPLCLWPRVPPSMLEHVLSVCCSSVSRRRKDFVFLLKRLKRKKNKIKSS